MTDIPASCFVTRADRSMSPEAVRGKIGTQLNLAGAKLRSRALAEAFRILDFGNLYPTLAKQVGEPFERLMRILHATVIRMSGRPQDDIDRHAIRMAGAENRIFSWQEIMDLFDEVRRAWFAVREPIMYQTVIDLSSLPEEERRRIEEDLKP